LVFFSARSKLGGTNRTVGKEPLPVPGKFPDKFPGKFPGPVVDEKFEQVAPLLISKDDSAKI
jgi:hypothetical protein